MLRVEVRVRVVVVIGVDGVVICTIGSKLGLAHGSVRASVMAHHANVWVMLTVNG